MASKHTYLISHPRGAKELVLEELSKVNANIHSEGSPARTWADLTWMDIFTLGFPWENGGDYDYVHSESCKCRS